MVNINLELKDYHDHGLIHGDIKSRNICIENDELYLVDFGSMKRIGEITSWYGTRYYNNDEMNSNIVKCKTEFDKF